MRISLDSNVFRDQDFIDWLQAAKDKMEVNISVISALETYHWYNIRGISDELFKKDMNALGAIVNDLTYQEIFAISKNAKKSTLQFRHHARDFMIGTQALKVKSTLITFNLHHFKWLGEEHLASPDELVLFMESNTEKDK
ncbi:MAG: type II toxin-antitoxin system VapC family toxin [Candidatus Hodarchaeales archaeon]|jgi:predicted nucleic acid-binding protein